MRSPLRHLLPLLVAAGALAGCGRSTPTDSLQSSSAAEENEVVAAIAGQPEILEDGIADSPDVALLDGSGGGLAAIQPLRFWREIRTRERRFEFAFSDSDSTGRPTRALVTIRTRLQGRFNVAAAAGEEEAIRDSGFVVRKPLDDLRVRRVVLNRVRTAQDGRARWRVAAASGATVTSRDHTTQVLSLQVQGPGVDTTITDPLGLVRMREQLRLQPDAEYRFTVATGRPDDVVMQYRMRDRFRLRNNGDNTYSGLIRTPAFGRGMRHLAVDALSRGTLFDDELPYDAQAWIIPFVIVPEVLDDPMP